MKLFISRIYGQIYIIPFIKITHTRLLNGSLEIIIGWISREISLSF